MPESAVWPHRGKDAALCSSKKIGISEPQWRESRPTMRLTTFRAGIGFGRVSPQEIGFGGMYLRCKTWTRIWSLIAYPTRPSKEFDSRAVNEQWHLQQRRRLMPIAPMLRAICPATPYLLISERCSARRLPMAATLENIADAFR